ncbi:prepilin-type N-terminal cleavage/methylation domain-containing protein [Thiomicrorhabdus sp. 6S3-12]|uniref:prepilin-type N-terminal cleavage/methylation domain-containing protein n=1 Tax=Thiomicrorhabdus sp. 6S3-12 TaxID=2819681 RepID=UPI001AAD1E59|nr:prepilin-type N-terminal cleavage/methylation domain-containing protein [Thiomicrorhabdus sp. 6S3-12]MBO1923853.1 prepilin-type N-terminal cleavage/methylation domain-containing protein [Thiomicrorhabdus sp. 6S3-12]
MKSADFKSYSDTQAGFTLVEVAIVLLIIGLLLSGILKGQEMTHSAKISADTDALKALQASIYAYKDRVGFYPGSARSAAPTNSHLDGKKILYKVSNHLNPNSPGDNFFFGELFDQGFLKTPNPVPLMDDGGSFTAGYSNLITSSATAFANLEPGKNYVCISYSANFSEAPNIVNGMDIKLDDGIADKGVVRIDSNLPPDGGATACLQI